MLPPMGARIAMVAEWYPPATGGMEEAARRVARASQALGLTVEVVTPDPQPRMAGWWTVTEPDGLTVTRAMAGPEEPLRRPIARALAARGPFDGVMCFGLRHFAAVAVRQADAWGVPSLVCARGSDLLRDLFQWETTDDISAAVRQATVAAAVTPEMARLMATLRPDGRVSVWPNTVDTVHFAPQADRTDLRRQWGLPAAGPFIGFVGILRPVKGQDVLLEAFLQVHERVPEARLLLIGESRAEAAAFLAHWRQRHPQASRAVQEVPYVPQERLPALLACLDQVWLPSLTEGFSNSLIECLACEVPVIATPVGVAPDVISDGQNGLLVPVGDVPAWAAAALRLIGDPAWARQLGVRGRQSLASDYSPAAEQARLTDCYRALGWL